ncbi:hypothetical protein Hypma_006169 [Hypsizygus marmoreus]|uniref:SAM domain-containing protein n=1 Tax=Hypsizygus marmoreus TaxID=39966 RepID=A0A369JTN7_HYPMA|nr:hypothetical protein Hypma_006169 [Hypsizygus marmoreus]
MSSAQPSLSSRPSSPTKPGHPFPDALRPNPHPYAIKTTATGILSRSATTSSSVSHSHNHYVPLSPSPSPTKSVHGIHASRGSRHRYSRSLTDNIPRPLPPPPPEDVFFTGAPVHSRGERSRADTLPMHLHADNNPKLWTPTQLAAQVPEIAAFIEENEITGRAFLRFDEGVLDAYGITQQSQRTQLLSASRTLRQYVLKDRIWPLDQDTPNNTTRRPSSSVTSSPSKSRSQNLPRDDEDDVYLSSSSSISSAESSLTGTRKRRYRPNSRVHGFVVSLERSEHEHRRERSGSVSSVNSVNSDSDFHTHHYPDPHSSGRPLPFPPPPNLVPNPFIGDSYAGPLLLPNVRSASPEHSVFSTPHVTENGNGSGRPLPSPPPHPSLRPPPVLSSNDENSSEMSMEQLLAVLNADDVQDPLSQGGHDSLHTITGIENVTTRAKPSRSGKEHGSVRGAAAWEETSGVETVKRALPAVPVHPSLVQSIISNDEEEEMSVEALLKLEEGGVGAAAWVGEVARETVKRAVPVIGDAANVRGGSLRMRKDGSGRVSVKKLRNSVKVMDETKKKLEDVFSTSFSEDAAQPQDQVQQQEAEDRLAHELTDTRTLLDAFRVRLEHVEAKVDEMEMAELRRSQTPTYPPPPSQQLSAGALLRELKVLAWAWVWSAGAGIVSLLPVSLQSFFSSLPWPFGMLYSHERRPPSRPREAHKQTGSSSGSCSDSPPPSSNSSKPPVRKTNTSSMWRILYPTTIPRYALLLGIGVCAVMLRGLMRGVRLGVGMAGVGVPIRKGGVRR